MEGLSYPCSVYCVPWTWGYATLNDLHGCVVVVWCHPPLFLTCLTGHLWAKKKKKKNVHEKGRIVCSLAYMPRTFPVGFCGSFLPAMQIFFLICDIPTYTLFYCIHWELPDKSLFVKILLNICSNLKVCLNKNLYIASCILFIICTSSVSNHHWVNKAVIKGRRQ